MIKLYNNKANVTKLELSKFIQIHTFTSFQYSDKKYFHIEMNESFINKSIAFRIK